MGRTHQKARRQARVTCNTHDRAYCMNVEKYRAVVIGAGTMGCGVATAFLAHGWSVCLVEPVPAALAAAPQRVSTLLENMKNTRQSGRLQVVPAVSDVNWDGVQIVSENAPEDLTVKQQIFATLAQAAPDGMALTSNSSTFPVSSIAENLNNRSAMLGAHFLMPAHLVPLVEVLDTGTACSATVDQVIQILISIGKKPVRITKELPGFLVNRMQAALMREALALIDEGVASPEDIDRAVRYGFGFRYAACGPIVQKEHSGWDISHKLYATVFPTLSNSAVAPPVLQRLIDSGETGMKSGCGFIRWDENTAKQERLRFNKSMQRALDVLANDDDTPPLDWRD